MNLLVSLAFRNLFRNLRRTLITSVAVVFGVALSIMGWGLVDGMDENFLRAARTTSTGDILLRPVDYPTDGMEWPLDMAAVVPPEMAAKLDAIGDWAPRTVFPARLVKGAEATRVYGYAYDAKREDAVFPRKDWALDGAWPAPGVDAIVAGASVARLLELSVGDVVVVEARTRAGARNALTFTVSGIVRTDNAGLDNTAVWIEDSTAERLAVLGGYRTHIAIHAQRGDPEAIAPTLDLPGWSARSLRVECADMLALNVIRRRALLMLVFVIMGIAATGIANTVIMSVYERVREVGTLLAMGMRKAQVRTLFLLEGAVMGLTAGVIGAVFGTVVVRYYEAHGIQLGDEVMNASGNMAVSSYFYMFFAWPPVLIALSFGVSVAVLASIWPARYAANLHPADAVRSD